MQLSAAYAEKHLAPLLMLQDSQTALSAASSTGHNHVVRLLLDNGANFNLQDKKVNMFIKAT